MKKNTSWKFTDESSVTFQSSVSGPGEFGPSIIIKMINALKISEEMGDQISQTYGNFSWNLIFQNYSTYRREANNLIVFIFTSKPQQQL